LHYIHLFMVITRAYLLYGSFYFGRYLLRPVKHQHAILQMANAHEKFTFFKAAIGINQNCLAGVQIKKRIFFYNAAIAIVFPDRGIREAAWFAPAPKAVNNTFLHRDEIRKRN